MMQSRPAHRTVVTVVTADAAVGTAPASGRPVFARWLGRCGWWVSLVVGGVLVAVYFAVSGRAQNVLYDGIRLAPGVVLLVLVRRLAPGRARAWHLFAAGEVLFGLGDVAWDVVESAGRAPFPSVADGCYLAGTALIVVGLLRLIRISTGQEVPALLDAAIGATGVGLLLWFTVFAAVVEGSAAPVPDHVVSMTYPVMDFFLLVVAARLAMGHARRTPTQYLLLVGVVSLIASDVVFALADSGAGYRTGTVADLGWLVTAVVWTAAVLHPSMAEVGSEPATGSEGLSTWRIIVLVGASLLGPAVDAAQTRTDRDTVAVAVFGAILILLIWARFIGLVREHLRHRAVEAEIRLARAGHAERQRIARELHDFVTHSLGAVMLQAGGAHRLLATDAKYVGEALGALEMIETRSAEALEEMRTLLDVLRREDDDRVVVAGAVRRPPVNAGDGAEDGAED
ncbi:MAG: hypothetical protein QOI99_517, partial [Actinomycetota bacterium]|nr:hypothetical protein [Actinomycetota bacterium]